MSAKTKKKSKCAMALGKRGGLKRAQNLSKAQRCAIARMGAAAIWGKS